MPFRFRNILFSHQAVPLTFYNKIALVLQWLTKILMRPYQIFTQAAFSPRTAGSPPLIYIIVSWLCEVVSDHSSLEYRFEKIEMGLQTDESLICDNGFSHQVINER